MGTKDAIGSYDSDKFNETWKRNSIIFSSGGSPFVPTKTRVNILAGVNYEAPSFVVPINSNGSGPDEIATFVNGKWRIFGNWFGVPGALFWIGDVGDIPVAGDWNCDGKETIGAFRPSTGQWFLRNSNNGGGSNLSFYFGNPGDKPVAGDWDISSCGTEIGVVRGRTWYLRSNLPSGPADHVFNFPATGSVSQLQPVLGDWDGDGDETPGYHR